ncbi:MAG: asparaginase [Sphingomonadales bacterium]|nr:asparaginase [Sphingomonadales bacterium]MDE2169170.1 asparaginase [Sphingomonadales bacterium]
MADILILTTGGTIDKVYFDALSEFQVGDTMVPRLLAIGLSKQDVRIVEIARKDSLELDDADRAALRAAVASAPESLIIITHGTDTMTQTAAVLSDIAGKTVCMFGALSPARFAESDAAMNLGMALATVQVAPPGIYIAMNGTVFDAMKVRKDRAANAFVPL